MNKGSLIVISGPAGSGKGTVVRLLLQDENYKVSVSMKKLFFKRRVFLRARVLNHRVFMRIPPLIFYYFQAKKQDASASFHFLIINNLFPAFYGTF